MSGTSPDPGSESDWVDTTWAEFFGPLDPALLFECTATIHGRQNAVFVYPHEIVVEGPEIAEHRRSIPLAEVARWWLVDEPGAVVVTFRNGHDSAARVPRVFRPALETALGKVLGPPRYPEDAFSGASEAESVSRSARVDR
ncbi:hypothetical protein [Frondihabitans cladoniiphilus]|uniref:Uncharacterized protein n=1 Tax=Frondihabitans cladoniiphilus TaxID=715785 RepID=A0ABP8W251_9MICO